MKKQLLGVAAFLFAGSVFAQENVDLTPAYYKFADQPIGQYKIMNFFHKANPDMSPAQIVEENYNEGAFIVAGGQFAGNPNVTYAQDLQAGTSIVDLGGEVGKVMCVNGVNSTYNTITGMNYAQCTGSLNWFNFNWFMDPANTPVDGTAETPNIRVRLVLNIYANTLDEAANVINSAYMMSAQNNPLPAGTNTAEGVAITSGAFAETYEDGEPAEDENGNYIYDPTKWLVYEWDTYCAEEGIPMRLKMEMNQGNLASATVFIKEISFTKLAENPEPILGTRKKTFVKYSVDPQKVDASIEAVKGQGGNAEYFNLSGIKVDAANLTEGVYVVKNNGGVSKVVIK